MAGQQTQPVYKSGMRGKEVPEAQRKTEGERGKTPIRRISIERAHTGHIVEVERHEPPPKLDKDGKPQPSMHSFDSLRERHAHTDKGSAMAHINELIDEMGLPSEGPGADKVSSAG